VLEGRRTELSAGADLPSFREHIRMLEVIRDRALAKGRENTALSAEDKIGKAMGYDSPGRRRADKNVRANPSLLPKGEGRKTAGETRHKQARNRSRRAPRGTKLARIGSNWQG